MALSKTSNPALGSDTFSGMSSSYGSGLGQYGGAVDTSTSMTLNGTVNKTGILLVLAVVAAAFTWNQFAATHNPASVSLEMLVGVFGGLVFALITSFKREWAPITAPSMPCWRGSSSAPSPPYLTSATPELLFRQSDSPSPPYSFCSRPIPLASSRSPSSNSESSPPPEASASSTSPR